MLATLDTERLQGAGAAIRKLARVGTGARHAGRRRREGSARELPAPAQGPRAQQQQAAVATGSRRRRGDGCAGRRRARRRGSLPSRRRAPAWRRCARISARPQIRSPIDGVVLVRSVEPGQTVASSLQAPVLFTLAEDLKKMELHVAVDEADVGTVEVGQQATFTVDAFPSRTFAAKITQVHFASSNTKSTSSSFIHAVELDLDRCRDLRDGARGRQCRAAAADPA